MGADLVVVVGVYRPPSGSVTGFVSKLESVLNDIFIGSAAIVIMAGDMNLDILSTGNSNINSYTETLHSLSFFPVITVPTRFSNFIENSSFS